jgi:uncharacterized protein (DUF433 family)
MALLEMPTMATIYPHIVSTPGICGGRPRIDGTRISVQVIAEYYHLYNNVDRILEALPHLKASEVHAALTYYFDHQTEIDEEIRQSTDIEYLKANGVRIFDEEFGKT